MEVRERRRKSRSLQMWRGLWSDMSQVRAPSIATECCSWQGLSRLCAEASSGSIDVVVLVGPIVHTEEKEGEISVRGITKKIFHHTIHGTSLLQCQNHPKKHSGWGYVSRPTMLMWCRLAGVPARVVEVDSECRVTSRWMMEAREQCSPVGTEFCHRLWFSWKNTRRKKKVMGKEEKKS